MKVVLDTNVIISGLQFGGGPRQILDLATQGAFEAFASDETYAELEEIFFRKFRVKPQLWHPQAEILKDTIIPVSLKALPEIKGLLDSNDRHVLAAATQIKADAIVSGDKKHLLVLGHYKTIPIMKVTDFLKLIDRNL